MGSVDPPLFLAPARLFQLGVLESETLLSRAIRVLIQYKPKILAVKWMPYNCTNYVCPEGLCPPPPASWGKVP